LAAPVDGFRVTARIVTWSVENVLKVPASALFRCEEAWCAIVIENHRAKRRSAEIGHRNALEAEVLRGLNAGRLSFATPAIRSRKAAGSRRADRAGVRLL